MPPPNFDISGMPSAWVDLHVHASLPILGSLWRKRVQGFPIPALDGAFIGEEKPLLGLACYQTYALGRRAARRRLFQTLQEYRKRDLNPVLRRQDLEGPAAVILGVESLRYLDEPADLPRLWDLGVRFLQPIHFLDTRWGRSSREGFFPPSSKGLTGLGKAMLAEMDRLGFILDIAHMNDSTAEECLVRFSGKVMCSHTGLRALRETPRNLSADMAREIFRRGGAVGITCWRRLLPSAGQGGTRAGWTRAIGETALALAALQPGARVAIGSDRGAPIQAPAWLFSPGHRRDIGEWLTGAGWDGPRVAGFFRDNALAFYREALPA